MEVAPRYKLQTLLTLLTRRTLSTWFTLLTGFTLLTCGHVDLGAEGAEGDEGDDIHLVVGIAHIGS